MEDLRTALSLLALLSGTVFCVIGGVGLLRLPDTYTRMHGGGIIDTLGAALVLIGLMLLPAHWTVSVKLGGILFFLFVTASTASHALIHAAYTGGLPLEQGGDAADEQVSPGSEGGGA